MLTIGIVSTAEYFVPQLLARFNDDHPGVELRLRVASNREQLVALMRAGEIDLSIMGRPPKEVATPRGGVRSPSAGVRSAAAARPGRCWATGVSALEGFCFIVREPGSGTRDAMEVYFAERRFEARIIMEMASNETIKQAVIAGMGLSFLSLHTEGLEVRSGLLGVPDV